MTAYLYDRYNRLIELINNCTVITPAQVEYTIDGNKIIREAGDGQFFSRRILK